MRPDVSCGVGRAKDGAKIISQKPFLLRFLTDFSLGTNSTPTPQRSSCLLIIGRTTFLQLSLFTAEEAGLVREAVEGLHDVANNNCYCCCLGPCVCKLFSRGFEFSYIRTRRGDICLGKETKTK